MASIPLGRGDQLLRLFLASKGGYFGGFWGFFAEFPWVNEYFLRKYGISDIFTLLIANIVLLAVSKKKRDFPGLNATFRSENGQKRAKIPIFGWFPTK